MDSEMNHVLKHRIDLIVGELNARTWLSKSKASSDDPTYDQHLYHFQD